MSDAKTTAREKQVLAKASRLSGAIEALRETCEKLRLNLMPIMSVPQDGASEGATPDPELCERALYLYHKAIEIENLNTNLQSILSRIEI